MTHFRKRYVVMLGVALIIIDGITAVFLNLSSNVQEKMEKSAIENIKGNVLLVADSVSSIRETHVNGIYKMTSTIPMDGDPEKLLWDGWGADCFSWAPVLVADSITGTGVCYYRSPFETYELVCEETALQGKRSVSDAYINSRGTWAFTVQCPIYEDGALTGAALCRYFLGASV